MTSLGKFCKHRKINDGSSVGVADGPGLEEPVSTVFVGVLTVSDRCWKGEYNDLSGPNLQQIIQEHTGFRSVVKVYKILPDEADEIVETLIHWSDNLGIELIITTGGTGLGSRDVTPEATSAVIERETPGFSIAIITASLKVTADAMTTRLKSGIRGKTLIINLPGSKKASAECLKVALPAIPHALECLRDERARVCDCTITDFQDVCNHRADVVTGVGKDRLVSDVSGAILQASLRTDTESDTTGTHGHHTFNPASQDEIPLTEDDLGLTDLDVESLPSSLRVSNGALNGNAASASFEESPNTSEISVLTPRILGNEFPEISVDTAFDIVLQRTEVLGTEEINVIDAFGRTLASDVSASNGLPQSDIAAVSGYAISGSILEGEIRTLRQQTGLGVVGRSQAASISFGSPLPSTTNTVIPFSDARVLNGNKIKILRSVPSGQGVRQAGTEFSANQVVLARGTKLGPSDIGKLTSAGVKRCTVYKNPVVAVLSVGNEDVELANYLTVQLSLQQHSVDSIDIGIVPEDPEKVTSLLKVALDKSDVIVTTARSESARTLLKTIVEKSFTANVHFGNVAMRPWKPSYFATCNTQSGQKLLFLLPDCPEASIMCTVFVVPALRKMNGTEEPQHTVLKAKVPNNVQLFTQTLYQQCQVSWRPQDSIPWIENIDPSAGNRPPTVYDANALALLPERTKECSVLKRGDIVNVLLITRL